MQDNAKMPPTVRGQYVRSIASRSGILSSAKWIAILLFVCFPVSGFVGQSLSESLGGLLSIVSVVACAYGRYRDWSAERSEKQQLSQMSDDDLRQAHVDFLAAGGKPRPAGITPAAWVGISAIVGLVAYGCFLYAVNLSTHAELVSAFKPVMQAVEAASESGDFTLPAKHMDDFLRFLDDMSVASMPRNYQEEFARFKGHAKALQVELARLPNTKNPFSALAFAFSAGVEAAASGKNLGERSRIVGEQFDASFKKLGELAI